jgi:uncharacterized membrane protein
LRKDEKGKVHIKETAQMGGGKGAAIGGVSGAGIGIFAGPALVVPADVGALIGGLAAKARDTGFDDARLQYVGDNLEPGTSAIVAVVEHRRVDEVRKELEEEADEAVAGQRHIATEDGIAVQNVLATDEFVATEIAAATEDEAAYGAAVVTDEGVSAIAADVKAVEEGSEDEES